MYKYYGDHWFESRHRLFGNIPLTEDHQVAHRLLRKFVQMPALSDLYPLVLQMKQHWDSRTLNSLPDDLDDALLAATSNDMGVLHQPAATRSVDWLQEHGRCLDHIRPGPSTLPQAGRGAFATRYLPAGTRITTSPVHHVVDGESFFRMYKLTLDEDYVADEGEDDRKMWLRHLDQVVGSQIIKNYCFGHAQSSVMICPYSSGVQYINHNQTLANVRVAWGDGFFGHNSELVESGTLQDLETTTRSTLALDYMATRDIAEGEELLIDYGDAWEVAWAQHVNHFVPGVDPEYRSARAWNIELENKTLRTLEESEDDPYPDNLQLRCHSLLMRTAGSRLRHFVWRDRDYGESCRILDRSNVNGTNLYTVQLELWPYDRDDKEITWMERRRVPRSAIRFFDMPATTDWHLSQAFRHVLHLPDDVFPEQWRNLA